MAQNLTPNSDVSSWYAFQCSAALNGDWTDGGKLTGFKIGDTITYNAGYALYANPSSQAPTTNTFSGVQDDRKYTLIENVDSGASALSMGLAALAVAMFSF